MADVCAAVDQLKTIPALAKRTSGQELLNVSTLDAKGNAVLHLGQDITTAVEIGKVVEVISRIASQTNLLALNATIEAASVGEAGKSFVVVANEVKELARQCAAATTQIRQQVETMQDNTQVAVKAITEVAGVVNQINQISNTIAAAVEEQSATTQNIASTVSGVSDATRTMAANIQNSAQGADAVSRNIQGVNQVSEQVATGAAQNSRNATELAQISARLRDIVKKFQV